MPSRELLNFQLNGHPVSTPCEASRVLLDLLREDLSLTGTKRGCDLGTCGCCAVLVDGRPTLSCLTLGRLVEGRSVTTIEGITPAQGLTPVQRAFVELGATQCGFCTPGFIVTATALLRDHPHPSHDEVVRAVAGNLCRCTGYLRIVAAIEKAAEESA